MKRVKLQLLIVELIVWFCGLEVACLKSSKSSIRHVCTKHGASAERDFAKLIHPKSIVNIYVSSCMTDEKGIYSLVWSSQTSDLQFVHLRKVSFTAVADDYTLHY